MTSEIPDSVSAETLKNLIGGAKPLPGSDQFPVIDFGGQFGGPSDLQYVICLLIQQSTDGVNIAQLLFAALHLLSVTESHLEHAVDRLDPSDTSLGAVSQRDLDLVKKTMKSQASDIRDAIRAVDSVASLLGPALSAQRAQAITKSLPKGTVMHSDEFFSRLLISDELINSLGISRSLVSEFVADQLKNR